MGSSLKYLEKALMRILDQKQASELVSRVSHFKDIKNKEEEGEKMEEEKEEEEKKENGR